MSMTAEGLLAGHYITVYFANGRWVAISQALPVDIPAVTGLSAQEAVTQVFIRIRASRAHLDKTPTGVEEVDLENH